LTWAASRLRMASSPSVTTKPDKTFARKICISVKKAVSITVAKSYMWKGFLVCEEMRNYFPIYEEAVMQSYMTLQLLHSEFPYTVCEENFIFFMTSVL
jgi:hypothetical protein